MDSLTQGWVDEDEQKSHDAPPDPASILSNLSTALIDHPVSAYPVLPPQIPSQATLNLQTSLANDSLTLPNVTSHLLTTVTPFLNASSLSPPTSSQQSPPSSTPPPCHRTTTASSPEAPPQRRSPPISSPASTTRMSQSTYPVRPSLRPSKPPR